tara:strand:+ start:17965 stop:18426 length:462 start_codon:yes stop_codon:yes gene_type:complete
MKIINLLLCLLFAFPALAVDELDNPVANQEYSQIPNFDGNIIVRENIETGETEVFVADKEILAKDPAAFNESLLAEIASLEYSPIQANEMNVDSEENRLEIDTINGRQSFYLYFGLGGYNWGYGYNWGLNWGGYYYWPGYTWGWGNYRYGCWW